MVKLEKPQALDNLEEILALTDAVMVARGDLGVELPPEEVPLAQKRIVRAGPAAGQAGGGGDADAGEHDQRPGPDPRRGLRRRHGRVRRRRRGDAVAETAAGQYPYEAVNMMDRIVARVEQDAGWRAMIDASRPRRRRMPRAAIAAARPQVSSTIGARAIVAFTASGSTALRVARERPAAPVIGLTQNQDTARRLAVVWGVHAVVTPEIHSMTEAVNRASRVALTEGLASRGDEIVVTAGVPFGQAGNTNALRVATVK